MLDSNILTFLGIGFVLGLRHALDAFLKQKLAASPGLTIATLPRYDEVVLFPASEPPQSP